MEQLDVDVSQLFSTYGFITAQRILEKYHIKLSQDALLVAIRNPFTFYYRILQIPTKNVLNGIILQQAGDFHVYTQKLFIDYLLSGESAKGEDAQGANTRANLEKERLHLIEIGEELHQLQNQQATIIANSQKALIHLSNEWSNLVSATQKNILTTLQDMGINIDLNQISKALTHVLVHCDLLQEEVKGNPYLLIDQLNERLNCNLTPDIKEKLMRHFDELKEFLSHFEEKINEHKEAAHQLAQQARFFRSEFYDAILKVIELIRLLPDYRLDEEQDLINREPLQFDKSIGEIERKLTT